MWESALTSANANFLVQLIDLLDATVRQRFQAGTVPEPLNLHGWQMVDEINRALASQAPSGYSTPVHLVTADNIKNDGGPKNSFDPDNGYRDAYRQIWGK